MAKSSGGTRVSSSSSHQMASVAKTDIKPEKINFGSAPSNYSSKTIKVGDTKYNISAAPTGYGNQMKRNGRFTVHYNGDYQDFRWGDYYGGYVSKSEAWKEVKEFIKRKINQ